MDISAWKIHRMCSYDLLCNKAKDYVFFKYNSLGSLNISRAFWVEDDKLFT